MRGLGRAPWVLGDFVEQLIAWCGAERNLQEGRVLQTFDLSTIRLSFQRLSAKAIAL